jgi:hypothetical protein
MNTPQTYNPNFVRNARLLLGRAPACVHAGPPENYYRLDSGFTAVESGEPGVLRIRPSEQDLLEAYWRATISLAALPRVIHDRREPEEKETAELLVPFLPAL